MKVLAIHYRNEGWQRTKRFPHLTWSKFRRHNDIPGSCSSAAPLSVYWHCPYLSSLTPYPAGLAQGRVALECGGREGGRVESERNGTADIGSARATAVPDKSEREAGSPPSAASPRRAKQARRSSPVRHRHCHLPLPRNTRPHLTSSTLGPSPHHDLCSTTIARYQHGCWTRSQQEQ